MTISRRSNLASVLLCSVGLVGALSLPAMSEDVIKLRMTAQDGSGGRGVRAIVDKWNAEHPEIQVSVEEQAGDAWEFTYATTVFASADGPNLSTWGCATSEQYRDMIGANMLLPLDDLWEEGAYSEGAVRYYTERDGHKYGLPITVVYTPIVYYNKKIFADLGLSPPQTWDELKAVTKAIRGAGLAPLVTLFDFGMVSHLPDGLALRFFDEEEYYALINNWSPESTEAERAYKWTDPNGIRFFNAFKEIGEENGLAADGYAGITDDTVAMSLFVSGKAAMWQTGSWGVSQLKGADIDYGYFYYPPANEVSYGGAGAWLAGCVIGFDRGNAEVNEATKKVLKEFATREGQIAYATVAGSTPARSDISRAELEKLLPPNAVSMTDDAAKNGAPPLIEAVITKGLLAELKEVVSDTLLGVATPEEAAQRLQDAWEAARNGG